MTLHRKKGLKRDFYSKSLFDGVDPRSDSQKILEKRFKPLRKQRKTTVAQAKRKAWRAFSLYIRKKDMNSMGYVNCYTCEKRLFYKDAQAGHGIGGRNNAVLFMEEVVKPQCVGCNVFGRGQYQIFTMKLIKELGMKEYERLVQESREIVKYKLSDYIELERYYKEQLDPVTS